MPATSEFAATHLQPLGITSTLDVGVWFQGRMAGVLRHAHIGEPRAWQSDEVEFAASIAAAISLALEASQRHAVTQALQQSEEKYRLVVDKRQRGDRRRAGRLHPLRQSGLRSR
jgi:GAF domain-containing protein